METIEIQNQVRYVTDSEGKPVEVILPVSVYQQLIELPASLEIYQQDDTQKSIGRAQRDLKSGRARAFKVIDEALAWLKR